MTSLGRIHTREEHAELLHEDIISLVARDDIMVFLALHFGCRCILRVSLFFNGYAHIPFDTQFNGRIVGLAVEQRSVAILLTIEVVFEREDIIRRVLVHRRVGTGTNDQCSV